MKKNKRKRKKQIQGEGYIKGNNKRKKSEYKKKGD